MSAALAPREARERVLRALARGPLYEGVVPMMATLRRRIRKVAAFIVCNCSDRVTYLPHKSWCRAHRWFSL